MVTTVQWDGTEEVLAYPNDAECRDPEFPWLDVMQTACRVMWNLAQHGIACNTFHVFDHSVRL